MNNEQKKRLLALRDSMKSYGYTDGVEELESIFPELVENELMTLDGLIDRLQEIREYVGHNCNIKVQVDRGNSYSNGRINMVASDYRNGTDSVLIQIDYESLKWTKK